MTQRNILLIESRKSLGIGKLLARMGSRSPAYSTITIWIRALEQGEDIRGHASGGKRVPDERIQTLVAEALTEMRLHSVRS
jgi:hypothetical protein